MTLESFLLQFAVGTRCYDAFYRFGSLMQFLNIARCIYADLIRGKYTIFEGSVQTVLQRESPTGSCSILLT